MEKIKLTSEQYDLLDDKLNHLGMSHREILEGFMDKESSSISSIFRSHFDIETLAKALIIGYEVKLTPEELVKQYYDRVLDLWNLETFFDEKGKFFGELKGIKLTLDLLGIEIEGVNKK